MSMLKIHLRNWTCRKFGRKIQASAHDQGYLNRLPWLKQFVPLFKKISPWDATQSGIRFWKLDLLPGPNYLHYAACLERYLVAKDGTVLARVPRPSVMEDWQKPILRSLAKLGANETRVAYLVVTTYKRSADITIFKFPERCNSKLSALADHVAELRRREERKNKEKLARLQQQTHAAEKEAVIAAS